MCTDTKCYKCPLRVIDCDNFGSNLYESLDLWFKKYNDQEIYNVIKSKLDKEVLEHDK